MRFYRIAGVVALAVVCLLVSSTIAPRAQASEWWCWDDPVVIVEGQVVQVRVGVPQSLKHRVTLADIVVTVPYGVDAEVVAVPSPHFPQAVTMVRTARLAPGEDIVVSAQVTVRSQAPMTVAIKLSQASGAEASQFGLDHQPVGTALRLSRFGYSTGFRQNDGRGNSPR